MKKYIRILASLFVSIYATTQAHAASTLSHEATEAEMQKLMQSSHYFAERIYGAAAPSWTPVADTADFKYVLMSSESPFAESDNLRATIAKNLPAGVTLVLLVDAAHIKQTKQTYSKYISPDRMIFATANDIDGGFWARDAFPYPVKDASGKLSLVEAHYYRGFEAGPNVAKALSLSVQQNTFTFVGGNLLADEKGNCFSINSRRLFDTTEADIQNAYGCKSTHLLNHVSGIGDVDEVLKPLPNNVMLTNTQEYVSQLEGLGYKVVMLPSIPDSYRTYANALIVGQTAFMPTYGLASDKEAQGVYEKLGYKVVGIKSNDFSDQYQGSVHCQTMAYPALPEATLLRMLHLKKITDH